MVLAGEFTDLREPGTEHLLGVVLLLVVMLSVGVLVAVGIKAAGAVGRWRAGWVVLALAIVTLTVAPAPVVFTVDVKTPIWPIQCGRPLLDRPDMDRAAEQPTTALSAAQCQEVFESRRELSARLLAASGALGVLGAGLVLVRPRRTEASEAVASPA